MQPETFFGIPSPLLGLLCYVISAVWIFVWPKPKAGEAARSFGTHFILRWFHTLAWVLLAVFFITSGRFALISTLAGLLALAVYLVFVVTLLRK
ncbi:MAG: hypothetical protein OHK0031_16860 [Anaerolineales bacterium]